MPHERTLLRDRNKSSPEPKRDPGADGGLLPRRKPHRARSLVTSRSASSSKPMRSAATAYSPPIVASQYGGSSEPRVTATPAARRAGSGCSLVARVQAQHDIGRGTYLEHRSPVSKLTHQLGILAGAHAVADPADPEREAAADAVRPRPLAGVDGQAEPGLAGDRERVGEVLGREARLVAAHAEAGDVRMRTLDRAARDLAGLVGTEVADAAHDDAALDAGLVAGVVDALGEGGEVLLVGQADVGGVVGRRGQLDVDRPLRARTGRGTRRRCRGSPRRCG